MSDIFREVDEEVRRSQAEAVWRRYGWLIVGFCVVVVAGVGAYRYMQWTREVAASAAGARFESAMADLTRGRAAEAQKTLEELAASPAGGYQALARMRLASELAKSNPTAAIQRFDAIAADAAVDQGIRDIAILRAGILAADLLPLADVERRLQPLISANGPFRHQAREMIAMAAVKANDMEKARQNLDSIIIDRQAPAELRGRAEVLIGVTRGVN